MDHSDESTPLPTSQFDHIPIDQLGKFDSDALALERRIFMRSEPGRLLLTLLRESLPSGVPVGITGIAQFDKVVLSRDPTDRSWIIIGVIGTQSYNLMITDVELYARIM